MNTRITHVRPSSIDPVEHPAMTKTDPEHRRSRRLMAESMAELDYVLHQGDGIASQLVNERRTLMTQPQHTCQH